MAAQNVVQESVKHEAHDAHGHGDYPPFKPLGLRNASPLLWAWIIGLVIAFVVGAGAIVYVLINGLGVTEPDQRPPVGVVDYRGLVIDCHGRGRVHPFGDGVPVGQKRI